jgi:hypothetical protein
MKINSLYVLSLLGLLIFNSCDSGEEIDPSFKVNYKNQDLQGKIDGLEWNYQSGSVFSAPTGNEFFHTFTILDTLGDTLIGDSLVCLNLVDSTPRIIFVMNTDSALVQLGETKLFHDPLQPSLTINIKFSFYDADTVKQFVTASQGAYEILNVDTTDNFIEGRMHVKANGKNVVNGNFRIPYCVY